MSNIDIGTGRERRTLRIGTQPFTHGIEAANLLFDLSVGDGRNFIATNITEAQAGAIIAALQQAFPSLVPATPEPTECGCGYAKDDRLHTAFEECLRESRGAGCMLGGPLANQHHVFGAVSVEPEPHQCPKPVLRAQVMPSGNIYVRVVE